MTINPISGTAVQGLQWGLQGMQRAAVSVAAQAVPKPDAIAPSTDFSGSLVEMKQGSIQARSSLRALGAYNDTLGTLLDVRA